MRNRVFSVSLLSAGLVLGGLTFSVARAEDQPKEQTTPKERPVNGEGRQGFPMLDRFHEAVNELKLNDDQKSKIDKMFEDARSQMKKLREEAAGDREAVAKKAREMFEKLRENIASVLNEDQKEQLKEKLQKAFQRGAAAGGDMAGRLKAAIEKLSLSEEQKTKVHDLLEDTNKKAKDLRSQAENGGQEAREKLRELMQETREKLGNILSDEQKQKLQETLQQAGGGGDRPARGEKKPSE
jgi:Spy/CpxP family protein refolding chaperone